MIVDVRSREEYFKEHIKGSLNIPLFDLEFYIDFLKDKEVLLYCDSGRRSGKAAEFLTKRGIKADMIPTAELVRYEKEGKEIICAVNYLSVKPGLEEEFEEKARELCGITVGMKGFLGSKVLKVSGISYGGSMLQGAYEDMDVKPTKYVMLTYWENKEVHEAFHKEKVIMEGFKEMMPYLTTMPYEEYYEILR